MQINLNFRSEIKYNDNQNYIHNFYLLELKKPIPKKEITDYKISLINNYYPVYSNSRNLNREINEYKVLKSNYKFVRVENSYYEYEITKIDEIILNDINSCVNILKNLENLNSILQTMTKKDKFIVISFDPKYNIDVMNSFSKWYLCYMTIEIDKHEIIDNSIYDTIKYYNRTSGAREHMIILIEDLSRQFPQIKEIVRYIGTDEYLEILFSINVYIKENIVIRFKFWFDFGRDEIFIKRLIDLLLLFAVHNKIKNI